MLCDARLGSPRLRLTADEAHSAEPATALKWTLPAKAVGGKGRVTSSRWAWYSAVSPRPEFVHRTIT